MDYIPCNSHYKHADTHCLLVPTPSTSFPTSSTSFSVQIPVLPPPPTRQPQIAVHLANSQPIPNNGTGLQPRHSMTPDLQCGHRMLQRQCIMPLLPVLRRWRRKPTLCKSLELGNPRKSQSWTKQTPSSRFLLLKGRRSKSGSQGHATH